MTALVLVSRLCAQHIEIAGIFSKILKYSSLGPIEWLFLAVKANLALVILVVYAG
jgi:hypothetical protein